MDLTIPKSLILVPLLAAITLLPCRAADNDPGAEDAPAVAADTGAKLEVAEPEFNFGVLRADEVDTVSHTFKFKNVGTGTLLLTKIKPSCGCTSAVASATEIAPGEEGTLSAAMKPKGKFGDTSVTVRVDTNDPAKSPQVFTIKGTVLSPWRVIPALLDMGDLGKGESQERVARIMSQYFPGDPQHKIAAVRSDNPAVQASTQEFETPPAGQGRNYVDIRRPVAVRVTGGEKTGPMTARVLVSTDDPKDATHIINVRWRVEGDLALSTKRVIVLKRGDKSRPVNFSLKSRAGVPFEVLSIEAKSKGGDANPLVFTPLESNTPTEKNYQVDLSENVQPGKPNLGDIVITTNHPEQKALTVPYTASVIEARPRVNTSE